MRPIHVIGLKIKRHSLAEKTYCEVREEARVVQNRKQLFGWVLEVTAEVANLLALLSLSDRLTN